MNLIAPQPWKLTGAGHCCIYEGTIMFDSDRSLNALIIAAVGGTVLLAAYAITKEYLAEKIELTKADWVCTAFTTSTYLQPTLIGKNTVLIPMPSTSCIEYKYIHVAASAPNS